MKGECRLLDKNTLPKLLPPVVISKLKMLHDAFVARALPRTLQGELTILS